MKVDFASFSFCYSITNLKYWGGSEQIISKTLQLLSDLSVGYGCVRKLVKLDEVQFMLNNHTVRIMHFVSLSNSYSAAKSLGLFLILAIFLPQSYLKVLEFNNLAIILT